MNGAHRLIVASLANIYPQIQIYKNGRVFVSICKLCRRSIEPIHGTCYYNYIIHAGFFFHPCGNCIYYSFKYQSRSAHLLSNDYSDLPMTLKHHWDERSFSLKYTSFDSVGFMCLDNRFRQIKTSNYRSTLNMTHRAWVSNIMPFFRIFSICNQLFLLSSTDGATPSKLNRRTRKSMGHLRIAGFASKAMKKKLLKS